MRPSAGTPSPHNSIDQWIQFIHHWKLHNKGAQRAFPGVMQYPAHVNDSEDKAPEPFTHNIQGLLLAEHLMPTMEYNIGQVSWCRSLAWLLGVAGCYRSIIDWAGLAPAVGQMAEWVGPHESAMYTLPWLATYLAANGVTYHDADDAWCGVTPTCRNCAVGTWGMTTRRSPISTMRSKQMPIDHWERQSPTLASA